MSVGSTRTRGDREQAFRLRSFAAQLFGDGAAVLLVVPSDPREAFSLIGEKLLKIYAAIFVERRLGKLLDRVGALREAVFSAHQRNDPIGAMEAAYDVSVMVNPIVVGGDSLIVPYLSKDSQSASEK
ncbi:MAG TPA: hypothetical protein V6C81_25605 [Planktothrix sp.]